MSAVLDRATTREARPLAPAIRSVVALVAAVLAVACLLWGLSYPGFPIGLAAWGVVAAAAALSLVVASGVRALLTGRSRGRAAAGLVLVTLLLGAGVGAARSDDGALLADRWAASQAAFEAELATAGNLPPAGSSDGPGYVTRYPGSCPARIAEFRVTECHSIDGGYLYVQAQEALTDESGIVYLPLETGSGSRWLRSETMTPLGGPWWSWTCHC